MANHPKHAKHAASNNDDPFGNFDWGPSNPRRTAYPASDEASRYSRSEAYAQRYRAAAAAKPRKKGWKRVLIVIAVLLVLLIGAAAAFAFTFESNLHNENTDSLKGVLADDEFNEISYTLVLGSDSRSGTSDIDEEEYADGVGRADVIMLVRTDPFTKTITLLSIPRDTPATINGATTKINEAFAQGGPAYAVEMVEELTGVPISHYVELDFAGTEKLIDSMGGVTVDVPESITDEDIVSGEEITIKAGEQKLDGRETLLLARTRKQYSGSQDGQRQSNVRNVASAVISEIVDKPPYEIPGLMLTFSECLSSDLTVSDIVSIVSNFNGDVTIYSAGGPTDGDFMPEYGGMWLCYPAPEKWAELMSVVESGGDPSTVE